MIAYCRLALGVVLCGLALAAPADAIKDTSSAEHGKFEELEGPFASGPEVTRACLKCHTEAARQVRKNIHWTFEFSHPAIDQPLGKRHVVSGHCGEADADLASCTSCHVGYGWKDASFDFKANENVDCLVCHDTLGIYVKLPNGAGHPPYEDVVVNGSTVAAPDLAEVAQSVGKSTRATCGSCHFKGGGGEGVKQGDLDGSLIAPPKAVDVHMSPEGLDYSCATCHVFTAHQQVGSRYVMKAKARTGVALPGREEDRPACESCHGLAPHRGALGGKLNDHVATVACQTCHIPAFARGGQATQLRSDGAEGRGAGGQEGRGVWGENVTPEYRWFDGKVRYLRVGETVDPAQPVALNRISGASGDPEARIWPFKVMQGRQPFDPVGRTLAVSQPLSGAQAPPGGGQAFVDTLTYWPITHMVAPADQALACDECHSRNGRLADLPGLYLPGRDRNPWIDRVGPLLLLTTLGALLIHGVARYLTRHRRA